MLNKFIIVFFIAVSMAFTIGAIDIYAPCLPDMIQDFQGCNPSDLQLTFSFNALGSCLASLFVGGLSDAFGRRQVFLLSLFGLALTALVAAFSESLPLFYTARLGQGLFGAAMPVVGLAIVSDLMKGPRLSQVMSWLGCMITASVALAPMLGGYIGHNHGWRSIFYFIALGVFILWLFGAKFLKETITPHFQFSPKRFWNDFRTLIKEPVILGIALINGLLLAGYISFITTSAYYYISVKGLSSAEFGLFTGLCISFSVLSHLLVSYLTKILSRIRIFQTGIALAAGGSFLMVLLVLFSLEDFRLLALPTILMAMSFGFIFAPTTALILERFHSIAGSASSFLAFVRMILLGLIIYFAGVFYQETLGTTVLMFLLSAFSALTLFWRLRKKICHF